MELPRRNRLIHVCEKKMDRISDNPRLPRLVLLEHPAPEQHDEILRQLLEFNAGTVGPTTVQPFAIVLKNPETETIEGGLWGESSYDWLYVHMLIISRNFRKRGLGSALLGKAEAIATNRGYRGIRVDTFSFQAPGFYEKLGYRRFGKLANYPQGHETIFYFKALAAKPGGDAAATEALNRADPTDRPTQ